MLTCVAQVSVVGSAALYVLINIWTPPLSPASLAYLPPSVSLQPIYVGGVAGYVAWFFQVRFGFS